MEYYNETIKPWLGIIAIIVIGFLMIKDPNLFDGTEISGRKQIIKLIFSYIWGIPVGIIALVVGGYMGYNKYQSDSKSDDEQA